MKMCWQEKNYKITLHDVNNVGTTFVKSISINLIEMIIFKKI